MKKVKIVGICIFVIIIALVLHDVFTPKVTRKSVINEFKSNKKHFTIVRDYLMTKEDNYYINKKTYHDDIKDENVKKSVEYLIQKTGCEAIYNRPTTGDPNTSKQIIFLRRSNSQGEFGIEYLYTTGHKISSEEVEIGDGWYFYHVSGT